MLVSFLVCGQISYFPCGRILASILCNFWSIYKVVIPTFFSLQINKIESSNFSLVLKRTF